jgi:lipopolysaccharide assembly outer membrane protein LptD (OstA)
MRRFPAITLLIFLAAMAPAVVSAQEQSGWIMETLHDVLPSAPIGSWEYSFASQISRGTNGVFISYGDTVLTADNVTVNQQTGEADADGNVRIEQAGQIWVGDHIDYNFKTRQMHTEQFRTGHPPIFAFGDSLSGDISNKVYNAENGHVTTDDVSHPAYFIRSSHIRVVPEKYIEAWNGVLYIENVPCFYFPYYRRNLGAHPNNLDVVPGYKTEFGPYLYSTYTWYLNDTVDGAVRADYREARGFAGGPELNLHLGDWGDPKIQYYYLHDLEPNLYTNLPVSGALPKNRQRFYFEWQATPATNLNLKALANYQSDPLVLHDFFEGAYANDPQPPTFVEANKYWDNWSLDALATPRINDFFDQVERIPDIKLTGWRQQIFNTPLYYESESSAGYYHKMLAATNALFGGTNGPGFDYAAARADTYHQIELPYTFFNWLNVMPHAGGRFTYYSHETGPGATNNEAYRTVFDTGLDTSFKASQLWAGATNSFFQVDGLRHIIEPSASYAFIPHPSVAPQQLPQFDTQLPSPLLLPIQLPDYNDIDAINNENVIRFGLRNTLQTKRADGIENLVDWNLVLDWQLHPNPGQQTFDDLYSDLTFRPRSWLTFQSQTRYNINGGYLDLAYHQVTFTPNEWWSWSLAHDYSRAGFVDNGDNLISSTMFLRLNDNWGLRAEHDFNAVDGTLQDQSYTVYRDMRFWTAAFTFRVTDNQGSPVDYTAAFTFSIKAHPKYGIGADAVQPYNLIGE